MQDGPRPPRPGPFLVSGCGGVRDLSARAHADQSADPSDRHRHQQDRRNRAEHDATNSTNFIAETGSSTKTGRALADIDDGAGFDRIEAEPSRLGEQLG